MKVDISNLFLILEKKCSIFPPVSTLSANKACHGCPIFILRKFISIPGLLKAFLKIRDGYWISQNDFSASTEMTVCFLLFTLLMWGITYII